MKNPRNVVGPIVRRLRFQQGFSQPELALRCQRLGWDISRDVIAKIEDQRRWVADFELAGLAKALGIEVAKILPAEKAALERLRSTGGSNPLGVIPPPFLSFVGHFVLHFWGIGAP